MENEVVRLYFIVKDLGAELGRAFEGGPDWLKVSEKAKELESLADEVIKAKGPAREEES